MSNQSTFSSYGAAVAGGADGGPGTDRATEDVFRADVYPTAQARPAAEEREPTKYVTFGCVEYTPQE